MLHFIAKQCSVPQCGRPHDGLGYCERHLYRFRRGIDLSVPIRTSPGRTAAFIDTAVLYAGENCLIWPFALRGRSGYPSVKYPGRPGSRSAHRLVCELAHGAPPTELHEAAHSCGNRICVAPGHLRWATHIENKADQLQHDTLLRGTRHPNNRLTEDDIRAIRVRIDKNGRELAMEYKVGETTISAIRSRRIWAWLD